MMRSLVWRLVAVLTIGACDTSSAPLHDADDIDVPCTVQLAASPAPLAFGSTGIHTSQTHPLVIENRGSCASPTLTHTITGPHASEFSIATSACDGVAVMPGASCTLQVTFLPTANGGRVATLVVHAGTDQLDVELSGSGVVIDRQFLSPGAHALGSIAAGLTTAPKTFTLMNLGGTPLTSITAMLAGSDPTQFRISRNACGSSLASGASCEIDVVFAPTSTGVKTASLLVASDAGMLVGGVHGTGTTDAVLLSMTPSVHDYGAVIVGQTAQFMFTVTNAGASTSGALATRLTGADAGQFSIVADNCTNATLAAGATCTTTVRFAPSSGGPAMRNAQLEVAGTPGGVDVALLSGMAITTGGISLSPFQRSFEALVGGQSTTETFTLFNGGFAMSGAISVGLAGSHPGDFRIELDTCQGQALASQATCTVSVSFRPTIAGARSATLTFSAAPGGTQTASLTGDGRTITASPPTVDFGVVASNQPGAEVTVTNPGPGATGAIAATLGGTAPSEFEILGDNCSGNPLAALATCTLRVRKKCPGISAPQSATLDITGMPGGTAQVSLAGSVANDACSAFLTINPAFAPFGDVTVGTTSTAQRLTVTNQGSVASSQLVTSIVGSGAASFAVAATTCTALQPGESCTVDITATPSVTGAAVATFSVQATGSTVNTALSVNGTTNAVP